MPDKIEVLSGQGLVARFDDVAVGPAHRPQPALQAPPGERGAADGQAGPNGGDQLASSLIAVLQRGDRGAAGAVCVVGAGRTG